jgi:hypothetical protein
LLQVNSNAENKKKLKQRNLLLFYLGKGKNLEINVIPLEFNRNLLTSFEGEHIHQFHPICLPCKAKQQEIKISINGVR